MLAGYSCCSSSCFKCYVFVTTAHKHILSSYLWSHRSIGLKRTSMFVISYHAEWTFSVQESSYYNHPLLSNLCEKKR